MITYDELKNFTGRLQEASRSLKGYLNLLEQDESCAEDKKLRLLKVLRFSLLDDIHSKQQLLDNVDYVIHKIKK